VNGNYIPAGPIGTFNVQVAAPDTTPPVVTGAAPNITTTGTQAETFSITYTDDSAVNASTIASGNVTVTAPNGTAQPASLVSLDSNLDGPVRVAIYSIPAPTGGWTTAANGTYSINMVAAQVTDVYGNAVPAQLITSFTVNIVPPVDTQPPTVTGTATNITSSAQVETFTLTYTDNTEVKASTIASGNVLVTFPNGTTERATLVSVDSTANGPVRVATYSIPGPAGGWTAYNNGAYAVNLRAGQVSDIYGNFVPVQFITSFNVNVPDTQGPVPISSAPNITTTGTQPEVFTVTYTDATAVNTSTIASGNILVSGPNNVYSQDATLVKVDSTANGPVRVATYSVPAPSGGWTAAYNGPYAIRMRANQVSDTLGNFAFAQFIGPFDVNTSPAVTSVSPSPVTGSASAQSLTINGSNFAAASTVTLHNLTTGASVNAAIVSQTTTKIVVSNVFGTPVSSWSAQVFNGTIPSGQVNFSVVAPVSLGITVSPNPVTGKTATLTASNGGSNSSTIFKWAATKLPSGATAPTFSANNTNAAQKSTITFSKAGSYTLTLTSTTGSTVKTATVTFNVSQTLSSIALSATAVTVPYGKTQQFTATAKDQFGAAMATKPAFAWSIASGGIGSVSTSGLYTAPATGVGSATVKAAAGGISASATVTVPIQVNFQPASAPAVSGYRIDSGATYASHSGLSYGWTINETASAVQRKKNSNELLDTNIGITSGAKWEIGLANGTYTVTFSVGDSSVATTDTIRLQGTTILNAVKLAANAFSSRTATVKVSAGLLTLDAGSAVSLATRIDDIQIVRVS